MVVPALITGAATLIGGMMANDSNKRSAKKQMKFQERMSSTAHQREMMDLRLGGLNPILSADGGGSSTPQGATFISENLGEQMASSANDVSRTEIQKDLAKTAIANGTADLSTKTKQLEVMDAEIALKKAQERATNTSARGMTFDNDKKEIHGGFWKDVGKGVKKIKDYVDIDRQKALDIRKRNKERQDAADLRAAERRAATSKMLKHLTDGPKNRTPVPQ